MEFHLHRFLIILEFVLFVNCLNTAVPKEDKTEYPNSLKRFKRVIDYTRWRMDSGTTEFIVKVPDEEIGTSKKVMAVNIDGASSENYNVVVAGAMVPSPTTQNSANAATKEYTRFVPPTTMPPVHKEGEFDYIAPIRGGAGPTPTEPSILVTNDARSAIGIADLLGLDNRNPQRDDSPPSGPQFVSRQSPAAISHQVAPLGPAPIGRLPSASPLKPVHTLPPNTPPRTTRLPDMYLPKQTTTLSKFFSDLLSMQQEDKYMTASVMHPNLIDLHRTTLENYPDIMRTTKGLTTFVFDKNSDDEQTTQNVFKAINKYKNDDINEIFDNSMEQTETMKTPTATETYFTSKKTSFEKSKSDLDAYDMMFYKDDDLVKPEKKEEDQQDYDEKNDAPPVRTTYSGYEVTNFTSLDEYYESETRKSPGIQAMAETIKKEEEKDDGNSIKADLETKEKVEEKSNLDDSKPITVTTKKGISPEIDTKAKETCNVIKLRPLNFNSARTLHEINSQLDHWSVNSPMVHRIDITHGNLTVMENPIYMLVVDDPTSGQTVSAKMTVMLVAGINGRDHHAVSAAMYFLYQLIERSEAHADLLSKYRFWVIPVFNPDGYEYSTTFPQRRQWIKNLQQYWDDCKKGKECEACASRGIRCTLKPCYGVNLDRNFEYQWIPPEELAAEHQCGSLYAGERQLSEPETKALAKFFHEQSISFYAFVTFKEGDVLGVMYPYSHTKNRRTFDNVYRQRALRAASAAYSISGRPYVAGQTSEFLPLYAGGVEDWVDGHLGIDNVYTIMMFRAADTYNPRLTLERVVHEAYAAMDTLLLQTPAPFTPMVAMANNFGYTFQPTKGILVIVAVLLWR